MECPYCYAKNIDGNKPCPHCSVRTKCPHCDRDILTNRKWFGVPTERKRFIIETITGVTLEQWHSTNATLADMKGQRHERSHM